jgi:Bardet-Biedl syndrome 9 protein
VSILVSKTAGRYRVQSDSLSALFLVSSELERRLTDSLSKDGSDQRLVSCAEPFPYADYFSCIEAHFGTRQLLVGLYSQINDSAHLFRVVQKKLLARFKDKNPAPLAGVEVMMRDTYARLLSLADEAEEAQRRLARQCIEVSSQSRLLVQMTALRLGLPQAERALLEGFLCVWHRDTTGGNDESTASGWEEAADAGMTYLLKTSLAKSPKDAAQLNITLEMPQSLDDLKKKVAVVFDRLDKGGRLVVANEAPSSRK